MGKSASEVRADIEDTRRDMSETIDAIADRTSPRRIVGRRRERMAEGWRSVRHRVMGKAEGARESAGNATETVTEGARRMPDKVMEQTQGNPVAAGVIAFGAGLLAASLIPASEPEKRLGGTLREQAGPVQEHLKQAGKQVAEDVRQTAGEGAEAVKQRAAEGASNVREDVQSS
jgi:hypothetical protein